METLSFSDAARKLARFDIQGHQIYFIDLILLCEMAWADGRIQLAERAILFDYLDRHVNSINRLAGCRVLTRQEAREFACRYLDERPDEQLCRTVREVIAAIRLDDKEEEQVEQTRRTLLNACLDIAASAVTRYPYGLTERFTEEEKECYHSIENLLIGRQRRIL